MKASTTLQKNSLAVLLVGEPKCSKSSVMMGFPNLAIIDWDLNLASAVRRTKTPAQPNGVDFDYVQPSVKDDGGRVPDADQWAIAVKETLEVCKNPKYKTIAIDGLGIMCMALCEHIVGQGKLAGTNKLGKMEIQNYADLARMLRSYIMTIRSSGKTLVVTSHQTADKDEMTGALRYYLAIPGQSKDTLGGCFTDVWAVTKRPEGLASEKYEIRTIADARAVPGLGCSFEFPDKGALNITNKSPQEIWQILEPKINAK